MLEFDVLITLVLYHVQLAVSTCIEVAKVALGLCQLILHFVLGHLGTVVHHMWCLTWHVTVKSFDLATTTVLPSILEAAILIGTMLKEGSYSVVHHMWCFTWKVTGESFDLAMTTVLPSISQATLLIGTMIMKGSYKVIHLAKVLCGTFVALVFEISKLISLLSPFTKTVLFLFVILIALVYREYKTRNRFRNKKCTETKENETKTTLNVSRQMKYSANTGTGQKDSTSKCGTATESSLSRQHSSQVQGSRINSTSAFAQDTSEQQITKNVSSESNKKKKKSTIKEQIFDHSKERGQKGISSISSHSGILALLESSTMTTAAKEPEDKLCGYHLKGKCNYGNNCIWKHTELPYLWQYSVLQGCAWNDFPDDVNVKIEESYSRPQNEGYSVNISGDIYQIAFTNEGNMKAWPVFKSSIYFVLDIKRLPTTSSAVSPPGHVFSTSWLWYWKDEFDKWQSYDSAKDGHAVSDTDSKIIEKAYMSGKRLYKFTAAKHNYTMFLKDWYQQNDQYGTKREVRRRPKLVTKEMIRIITQSPMPGQFRSDNGTSDVPSHWDPVPPGIDYILVQLRKRTSNEYKKTEQKFYETMPRTHRVVKIERVQNTDLWMDFVQKRSKLTKKTGSPPEERQLFHGTSSEIVKAICQQGFDWRVCGKHGTLYGNGSYFATSAAYSHKYTKRLSESDCQHKQMFLSRVIVGSFAAGSSDMVKPPPKDPRNPYGELYDSCVDNTSKPGIFVVFENGQSYPEFLITYQ